ncbi:MAG: ATP-binding protein [Candidatus Zhuqueibacterota bacterium]
MFKRKIFQTLLNRISDEHRFIQVLAGPRQTGKTTLARQLLEANPCPIHYISADEPSLKDRGWIEQQWETCRFQYNNNAKKKTILILDEIQKIPQWSETVKRLWDADTANQINIQVILLGSSPLLMKHGLSESLAGRFEIIPVPHWNFSEMREAFGWDIETFIFYGGYPGAAKLINDHDRWARYIIDSLIETTVSRDILLVNRVDKPALLRRLFELSCHYSGQILAYQKMLGQLQDAGNTTTLAHYLDLLSGAGLVTGLQKYAGQQFRRRSSSPKLIMMNNALMTALSNLTFSEAQKDTEYWGRLIETTIGGYLLNESLNKRIDIYYWSGRNREVDFILQYKNKITAIEVKSTRKKTSLPGIAEFSDQFSVNRKLLVGGDGIHIQDFLKTSIEDLF